MPLLSETQIAQFTQRTDALRRRMFLQAGRAGELKVENFQAPTGIGRFDLTYYPNDHLILIEIRVFYDWQDKAEPGRINWDEPAKADFRIKAKRCIEDFWSERYMLTCRRPGWLNFYGDVKIRIIEVTARPTAHFVLEMRRVTPDNNKGGGVNWGPTPPVCDVNQLSVEPKVQYLEACFNLIEKQMIDAVASHDVEFIPFAKDNAELSVDSRLKLMRFAQYLGRVRRPDAEGIRLYVLGATNSKDSFFQTGLAKKRANAVKDFLATKIPRGEDFVVALDSTSGKKWLEDAAIEIARKQIRATKASAKFQGACLVVHTPKDVVRETHADYLVLAHEAGHFLGLPDEYMGRHHPRLTAQMDLTTIIPKTVSLVTSTQPVARTAEQQLGMANMLEETDLPSPIYLGTTDVANASEVAAHNVALENWYQQRDEIRKRTGKRGSDEEKRLKEPVAPKGIGLVSRSIMYSGTEVLPAHYLPIWSALAKATEGYLDPREWVIVPSTKAHPGSVQNFIR